ncbi:ribonucleoside-diphosphate reductase subunit alpha [Candidatus Profftella armatura]|uniref:Vitamin B12-dependent ribonucleotide reductase n=1 Tax=Candidatus Profftella armatura TaxID=669502 RepID=S5RLE4_9PROT|nr:ribonucleoside-diphosphate reductase subunit alpha [Candidatus Profftella armatura]AGS06756.1 ribonucleotide-diphosphate reductase subunit alpha [Candidatus Profftella armatura]QLK13670.1 ribonucleoside-diphosphate reductase subunit alpha [Candidatus Profftella armatura]
MTINLKEISKQDVIFSKNIMEKEIYIIKNDKSCLLDMKLLRKFICSACIGLEKEVNINLILSETKKNLYNGISIKELHKSSILATRTLMEKDPVYSQVTARLLMYCIQKEVFGKEIKQIDIPIKYKEYFSKFINKGIDNKLLNPKLAEFNLSLLSNALLPERDLQFNYLGLKILYDRYFLHIEGIRIEMPQFFFMRIAMGLSLNESNREKCAIKFYNLLSSFNFMCSTPTLFNSGTIRSQLSSCYLSTVPDDLYGIFESIKENALLSKYAGGLGNDWTQVRSLGSPIKGTNGRSQGVIPFLKVVNDVAVAVNQGGKRKGAICAYLETWHMDIEEFIELRKNTGDDRRRTHDMNIAIWVPDLFMKRVIKKSTWTLFSPYDVPDLHNKFGKEFEESYILYENQTKLGKIKLFKKISALYLWRKILSMLFETGHPWITFKDACNIRSPQQHVGIIHSSNLCTEITLNTSKNEIGVCNLGSINLTLHMKNGKLDPIKLKKTIRIAMRMLDNVIDINYYAVKKAKYSNLRHRPVGLGIMGFQDCLHIMKIPYSSKEAIKFADQSMEMICYYAYYASTELAEEKGRYSSYDGSLWDQGILPQDSLKLLEKERGSKYLKVNMSESLNWKKLRNRIKKFGMRNSNCVAIAPTATISNIIGVSASIEPTYRNLHIKSNLSGEFTEINRYLVKELKKKGLWDESMIANLKYFDGNLSQISRIPDDLRKIYATAFEISPNWIIEAGSVRQKWIDQSQSLNIYISNKSGKKLDETYKLAWLRGLKTTYYLRSISANYAKKSNFEMGIDSVNLDEISIKGYNKNLQEIKNNKKCLINSEINDVNECESCQ